MHIHPTAFRNASDDLKYKQFVFIFEEIRTLGEHNGGDIQGAKQNKPSQKQKSQNEKRKKVDIPSKNNIFFQSIYTAYTAEIMPLFMTLKFNFKIMITKLKIR